MAPPDGNPKTVQGLKKPPLISVIPTTALLQIGAVMRTGKEKYGAYNWRDYPVTASTYVDAAMRHLVQYWDGETVDPESGLPHLAHAAASIMVLMDALATGNGTDDRPKAGVAGELIRLFAENGNGTFTPKADPEETAGQPWLRTYDAHQRAACHIEGRPASAVDCLRYAMQQRTREAYWPEMP